MLSCRQILCRLQPSGLRLDAGEARSGRSDGQRNRSTAVSESADNGPQGGVRGTLAGKNGRKRIYRPEPPGDNGRMGHNNG